MMVFHFSKSLVNDSVQLNVHLHLASACFSSLAYCEISTLCRTITCRVMASPSTMLKMRKNMVKIREPLAPIITCCILNKTLHLKHLREIWWTWWNFSKVRTTNIVIVLHLNSVSITNSNGNATVRSNVWQIKTNQTNEAALHTPYASIHQCITN